MKACKTIRRYLPVMLVSLLAALGTPALAQTAATWNGGGGDTSYDNPSNWDIGRVPVNDVSETFNVFIPASVTVLFDVDLPQEVTDLQLAAGSTLDIQPGKSLSVLDDAELFGIVTTGNGTFQAAGAAAQFPGNAARLLVGGGGSISVAATSYSSAGTLASATLFSASDASSLLDLSSLQSIAANFSLYSGVQVHTISATNGGAIDLSSVQSVLGPALETQDRLDFVVNTDGTMDLSSLQQVTTGNGKVQFNVSSGGSMTLGDLVVTPRVTLSVDGATSQVEAGHLHMDATGSFAVTGGATLTLGGNFGYDFTSEGSFNGTAALLELAGTGPQWLEAGGEDLGVNGATSGNFGLAQLTVGTAAQATTVVLVDMIDNGNRTSPREALYLFGSGGVDGLHVLGGSSLVLGDINVYALIGGTMTHINGLFGAGETSIAFDGGFLDLSALEGDFDADGDVDADDIDLLLGNVLAGANDLTFELTGDSLVDQDDADRMIHDILGTEYGDANLDRAIDGGDLSLLGAKWLTPRWASWGNGDFNGDGAVDGGDLSLLGASWLWTGPAAAVPEPATLALLTCGGLGLILRRRRLQEGDAAGDSPRPAA